MVEGLLRGAYIAGRWAATAEYIARDFYWIEERLKRSFTREEIAKIESYYGAIAMRAIGRTLAAEADREHTDPGTPELPLPWK